MTGTHGLFYFMGKCLDITGEKYGKLTAIRFGHTVAKSSSFWYFKCDCGNEILCSMRLVRHGLKKSCGCIRHKVPHPNLGHLFTTMKKRCFNSKDIGYKNYGGRGITICEQWLCNRKSFYDWAMANGYKDGLQIDRINNNGNYEPSNCRFVTRKVNANNKRNTIHITYKGITLSISEWSEKVKIPRRLIKNRYSKGYSAEKILAPKQQNGGKAIKVLAINVITGDRIFFQSRTDAARNLGVNISGIMPSKSSRIRKSGYTFEFLRK